MMKTRWLIAAALATGLAVVPTSTVGAARDDAKRTDTEAKSVLDFTLKDIDGKEVALKTYEGNVLLVVNVASK